MYELVESLALPAGSRVVDVGCGNGRHSIQLAERYGFDVTGLDPVPGNVEAAQAVLSERGELRERVRFLVGRAEALSAGDQSADLVWCKGSLLHVADIDTAYAEVARVLRRNGHALVYQKFATPQLEPQEADRLFRGMQIAPNSVDPRYVESAVSRAGLRVERVVTIGLPQKGVARDAARSNRLLLHSYRLFREPERLVERFGQAAYDTVLGKCLFHLYPLIGKLEPRVYLLRKQSD